jgi:hypothetical protein
VSRSGEVENFADVSYPDLALLAGCTERFCTLALDSEYVAGDAEAEGRLTRTYLAPKE